MKVGDRVQERSNKLAIGVVASINIVNGVPLYRVKWEQEKKVNQKQYTVKALKHAAIKRGVNCGKEEQLLTSCNQNVEITKVFKPKKISKLISKQTDSSPVVVSCTDNDDNSNEYCSKEMLNDKVEETVALLNALLSILENQIDDATQHNDNGRVQNLRNELYALERTKPFLVATRVRQQDEDMLQSSSNVVDVIAEQIKVTKSRVQASVYKYDKRQQKKSMLTVTEQCDDRGHVSNSAAARALAPGTATLETSDSDDEIPADVPGNAETLPINIDAKKYEKHLKLALTFHTCGICSADTCLKECILLSSLTPEIQNSELAVMHQELIQPLYDDNATKYQKNFAAAAASEMHDGILLGALYACGVCVRQLKKFHKLCKIKLNASLHDTTLSHLLELDAIDQLNEEFADDVNVPYCQGVSVLRRVPKMALVNGHFRGTAPLCLTRLSRVELSMVCKINCIYNLSMLKRGCHWGSTATVFSVLNDVHLIAQTLPRLPSFNDWAIIRSSVDTSSPRDYNYTPYKVIEALLWLEDNNYLWENSFQRPDSTEWEGAGSREFRSAPVIDASVDDYDGLDDNMNGVSGAYGHVVNPNAPPSNITDVFLQYNDENQDLLSQVGQIMQSNKKTDNTGGTKVGDHSRSFGEYVRDYETAFFLQMSFVSLFPYGRGGPEPNSSFKLSGPYLSHLLKLGRDREFQQVPGFVFYAYSYVMKQKSGTISYLATKKNPDDPSPVNVTVADAREFIDYIETNRSVAVSLRPAAPRDLLTEVKMRLLLNRLLPYAALLVGTELYMKSERKKLLSMISAAVTNTSAMWAYFFTEAQPDKFLSDIYDNAITSAQNEILKVRWDSPVDVRQANSTMLNKARRNEILRSHPLMSARIHAAQQTVFWKYIVCGKDAPFGIVKDYWRRVEFQERGTPHSHNLINVEIKSGGVDEDSLTKTSNPQEDSENRDKVKQAVKLVATATLQPRHKNDFQDLPVDEREHEHIRDIEKHFQFKVDRANFADAEHPCRERFYASGRNFARNSDEAATISDLSVQSMYRRLQSVNQMHVCQTSCFKYCRAGESLVCRYDYPKCLVQGNFNDVLIIGCRDRRGRQRLRIEPPRTNANLNVCCMSPLIVLASKGNHDIQYIANKCGGAEYVSKYASKTDTADSRAMLNAISRKLAVRMMLLSPDSPLTLRVTLRAVANALISSQQIGSVHACYVVCLASSLVQSSRENVYVNALPRLEIDQFPIELNPEVLEGLEEHEDAIVNTITTTIGKRDTYYMFYKYHTEKFGVCDADYYAILTAYRMKSVDKITGVKSAIPVGLKTPLKINADSGLIENPESFILNMVLFSAYRKSAVVTLSPYIPINDKEGRSYYATLLLHSKWDNGEAGLLGTYDNALGQYDYLVRTDQFPPHVKKSLSKRMESERLLADTGDPDYRPEVEQNDDDNLFADLGDDLGDETTNDRPQLLQMNCDSNVSEDSTPSPCDPDNDRIVRNCKSSHYQYLFNFIGSMRKRNRDSHASMNQCNASELAIKVVNPDRVIEIAELDSAQQELEASVAMQNAEQSAAYQAATEYISEGLGGRQLFMVISGEGGVGKSKVINDITKYTQIRFGKTEGFCGSVAKTAPTGGAAFNIGGHTWHSLLNKCGFGRTTYKTPLSPAAILNLQRQLKGVKLFILDEVSLLCLEDMWDIHYRLCHSQAEYKKPFGGLHVIFAGDFHQMKSVGGTPIVTNSSSISQSHREVYEAKKIWTTHMTHFAELVHNVRAQSSIDGTMSKLALVAKLARVGDVKNILPIINAKIALSRDIAIATAHENAVWVCPTHDRIQTINDAFLEKFIVEGRDITRLVSVHCGTRKTPPPNAAIRNLLYQERGSVSGKGQGAGMMPSYMDVCVGTRIRIVSNILTECGIYNGAMGTVWGFVYKGEGPKTAAQRVPPNFSSLEDYQRELPIVLVRMDGTDKSFPHSCVPGVTRVIPLVAVANKFRLSIGETKSSPKYARYQIPMLVAHARTGHSIQGYTALDGVVIDVGSKFYAGEYVALSRATHIDKIMLLEGYTEAHFHRDDSFREMVLYEYLRLSNAFDAKTFAKLKKTRNVM